MFNSKKEINSRWETEKRWIKDKRQEVKIDITTRKLIMAIVIGDRDKPVLQFRGGPTGFETYYVEDLHLEGEGDFCICSGTANRWPACYVDKVEVQNFLNQYKAVAEIS